MILNIIAIFILAVIIFILSLLIYLTINEYKPKDTEEAKLIKKGEEKECNIGDNISIITYNIGYCNDSSDSDFFMDGGKRTRIESKKMVIRNLKGIEKNIKDTNSDIIFIQEIDEKSKRGYNTNEVRYLSKVFKGTAYFAKNFYCKYIPYPIKDTIGYVKSGILTINPYKILSAKRYSLPVAFKYPIRLCQLKRCLLVERIKIKNSTKQLILINLHLEAYDKGEGKIKQTKLLTNLLKKEYEKGNYCVAGGDFNQIFPNTDMDKYPLIKDKHFKPGKLDIEEYLKGWNIVTDDTIPTSRLLNEEYDEQSPNTQYHVIDGFILSPNITLNKIETINTKFNFADHNPVKIDITLKE